MDKSSRINARFDCRRPKYWERNAWENGMTECIRRHERRERKNVLFFHDFVSQQRWVVVAISRLNGYNLLGSSMGWHCTRKWHHRIIASLHHLFDKLLITCKS